MSNSKFLTQPTDHHHFVQRLQLLIAAFCRQTISLFLLVHSCPLVARIHLVCDLHVRQFQVKVSLVLECHFDHKGLGLIVLTLCIWPSSVLHFNKMFFFLLLLISFETFNMIMPYRQRVFFFPSEIY